MERKIAINTKNGIKYGQNKRKRRKSRKLFHIFLVILKLRSKITLLSLIIIICLLEALKISINNDLSIRGHEYIDILTKEIDQKRENVLLYQELLKSESFTTIYQNATNEGFVPATYILWK